MSVSPEAAGAAARGCASDVDPLPDRPAAAVKVLGSMLRDLRLERDMGLKAAAAIIRGSASKISRLERGESPPKHHDVLDLVRAYGVRDPATLATVEDLLRKADQKPWWHRYADVTPGWVRRLISLEESATRISTWEVHVVPGLLQTPEYARAVITNGFPGADPREIEQRVLLRRGRQEVLGNGQRTQLLIALLDESVLQRPVGGPEVMAGQMRFLLQAIERRWVQVRIVRFSRSATLTPPSSMTLLRFEHGGPQDLVYLEHVESATYLSRTKDVERYRALLESLYLAAESRARSKAMILEAHDRYRAEQRAASG
ncbi:helix-turn-helix domain-containing protein [Embleya sp. NPDC008237]|uniref:helix-turn-helix domain-containing protein n=1 Tax=Embleya sp. NPDC008237 TaxID=3363978 RepID=UPI0036EBC15B